MGLLSSFFKSVDNRPKTGFAIKEVESEPSNTEECRHDWEEVEREELGYDGGGYRDGRGEMWYAVTYKCKLSGCTKVEKMT